MSREPSLVSPASATIAALMALACGSTDPESPEPGQVQTITQAATSHPLAPSCGDHAEEHDHPFMRELASKRLRWKSRHFKKERTVHAKILGINDFHGQLSAGRFVGGRPVGGAAVLASYLREADDGNAILMHAGDHVGASPPASALLQDEPSITFLNLLANASCHRRFCRNPNCNVVGTLGNHEFDEGTDEMLRLIDGGEHASGPYLEDPYRGAEFPYVSANVVSEETGRPILPPYVIKRVQGVPIGVIGAVLKETPTIVTPTGVAGLSFLDEAETTNRYVRELRRKGVRTIILTIHQGGSQAIYEGDTLPDGTVAGAIRGIIERLDDEVDVVVSGHAHSFTNALVPNENGVPILVTQAFSASTAYGDIDLEIDRWTRDVVAKSARIVTTYADVAPGNVPDPEVADLVAQAEALTAPLVNEVVGESAAAISRTQNAAGESALGNLIADAQRQAMGTDFAFMNPGGIRADLDAGEVTWGELFTIQPFGNSLIRMTLTGQQIYDLLNQQWLNQPFPRILQVSGLTYDWDETLPIGDRVVEVRKDGMPIVLSAEYTVTVNSFIAAGGDNFTVLPNGTDRVGGPVDLDALLEYIDALTQPFSASIEGRITKLN